MTNGVVAAGATKEEQDKVVAFTILVIMIILALLQMFEGAGQIMPLGRVGVPEDIGKVI